ncbi:3-keto-5-aminohexanoate cleavage protein [Amycolatopsis sp. NPDC059090]|uniref:3-keto-5-aminohexanoate cleavage protein n=2 Tax=unclassified Amycolatopsis TaxID=2618356 RepID=UPI00367137BD
MGSTKEEAETLSRPNRAYPRTPRSDYPTRLTTERLTMSREVMITCALTGSGDGHKKNPSVPVTPKQIAEDALRAAKAGAAAVHAHVREPDTGEPSRRRELYREVLERIREVDDSLIVNLTGGMGGEMLFGPPDSPLEFPAEMDFVSPTERIEHILELRPDIGSFDCGSVNFGDAVYATTPSWLEQMARQLREAGVAPEVEVFDLGHIELAKSLIAKGLLPSPTIFQLCLGVRYGAPATPEGLLAMRSILPADSVWFAFGVGARQLHIAGLAVLLGGHVRVGLEDNIYLARGVLATNEQLVERAVKIIESLGDKVMDVTAARRMLGLTAVQPGT